MQLVAPVLTPVRGCSKSSQYSSRNCIPRWDTHLFFVGPKHQADLIGRDRWVASSNGETCSVNSKRQECVKYICKSVALSQLQRSASLLFKTVPSESLFSGSQLTTLLLTTPFLASSALAGRCHGDCKDKDWLKRRKSTIYTWSGIVISS